MKIIDLHTHTYYSDGGLSPTELVIAAKKALLSAIAVTDHDTTNGLGEAMAAGDKFGVEVVKRIELSTDYKEYEPHILGYFIDPSNTELQDKLSLLQADRGQQAQRIITNLNKIGYELDFSQIRKKVKGSIGRPHIAVSIVENPRNKEILSKEFGEEVKEIQAIFRRYLAAGCPLYEESKTSLRFEAAEAMELIGKSGGVSFLAHPCWDFTQVVRGKINFVGEGVIRELRELRLVGIEAIAFRETAEVSRSCQEHYQQLADKLKLLISGGSDFHGYGEAGKSLGLREENMLIDSAILERIKAKR